MSSALLPVESTKWERATADAMAPSDDIASAIRAMRGFKYSAPRPSMLPFLVWEYGLGELTPYVPNLYQLIDQGVRWQRVRGTVSAVAIGLAWIGYTADLEETWSGRRWWNSFQLRFRTLPADDNPDLERIEGITTLSVSKRSDLRRGVYFYDVEPMELDEGRLDGTMLDHESGIAVTQVGTIWSFGRLHEFEHTLTEAEGVALGMWLEPTHETPLLWADMDILWDEANFLWADEPAAQRAAILANWFAGRTGYVRLSNEHGVIGYRRCRSGHVIRAAMSGPLTFDGVPYEPAAGAGLFMAEALTQFDDADGQTCTELALIFDGAPAPGVKPGRQWLAPEQFIGGTPVAVQTVSIPLRRTVREQIKFLMRF